jgi:mannosyltransferase OCH1-like enzyme
MPFIPKSIHQIWFQGKENMPAHLLEYHNSWKRNCPDYRITVWDDTSIRRLLSIAPEWVKDTYESYEKMIQKIDFAKYVILYYNGGVYIDMDVTSLKSLNETPGITSSRAIFSKMPYNVCQKILMVALGQNFQDDIINNGIIFAEKYSEIMMNTMKECAKRKNNVFKNINNTLHVFSSTGPVCLTKSVPKDDSITILDNTYFEACDIDSVRKQCAPPGHAIGLHVYEGSWVSSNENAIIKLYFFVYEHLLIVVLLSCVLLYLFRNRRALKLI